MLEIVTLKELNPFFFPFQSVTLLSVCDPLLLLLCPYYCSFFVPLVRHPLLSVLLSISSLSNLPWRVRVRVDIAGLAETRRPCSGEIISGRYIHY